MERTMRISIDAEKFMERLRNGETPRAIISGKLPGGVRICGIGTYETFRAHCAANPKWGCEAIELAKKNAAVAQKFKGANKRNMTHCQRGHPLSGENLGTRGRKDRTSAVSRYCKLCHFQGGPMSPSELRRVTAAVKAGCTIVEITKSAPNRRPIVTFAKLRRYRVEHPEFDRFIIQNASGVARGQLIQFRIVPANAKFQYSAPT